MDNELFHADSDCIDIVGERCLNKILKCRECGIVFAIETPTIMLSCTECSGKLDLVRLTYGDIYED